MMTMPAEELLVERERLVGYGLVHSVALIDAELASQGLSAEGNALKSRRESVPAHEPPPGRESRADRQGKAAK